MQGPSSVSPRLARLPALDALRGLIMVLMAVDHASFFIARAHATEFWGVALPRYPDSLAFLTRFVTHLCAPGFLFLMGAGMALFTESRRRIGWSGGRIARYFAARGVLLVLLQQLVENPAWIIGFLGAKGEIVSYGASRIPGGGGSIIFAFGVLFALGAAMILGAVLVRAPAAVLAAVSLAAIGATQALTPAAEQAGALYAPWLRLMLIPGQTGIVMVLYPVVPWLGIAVLGMLFGRQLLQDADRLPRRAWLLGAAYVLLFLIARGAGIGDFHPPAGPGWIPFLNVTKYPPSLDFILVTLGGNLLLLSWLASAGEGLRAWGAPLLTFGRTPLFFYLAHLYLYALMGLAFPRGMALPLMYPVWLVGLMILYPLCRRYERFKQGKPPESAWRLF